MPPRLLSIPVWLILGLGTLSAEPPQLTHCSPSAALPGQTVEVVLHGKQLAGSLHVWTSFPATVEVLDADPADDQFTRRTCRITIPPQVPLGVGGLLVANASGISAAIPVVIDDLPTTQESGDNHSAATAMPLATTVAVEATSDGPTFDFFALEMQAGQVVGCEVLAGRAGSAMDAVVRILDPAGKQIALVDEQGAVGGDCRFSFAASVAGRHVVQIHDNQYRGGLRYRLRIGDFPAVETAYPLAVRAGSTASLSFAGSDDAALQIVTAERDPWQTRSDVTARRVAGGTGTAVQYAVSQLPQFQDNGANNDPAQTQLLDLPCGVSGRFEQPADQDHYQLVLPEGARLRVTSRTRLLGSTAFAYLRLFNAQEQQVAEVNLGDDQAVLEYAAPAAGAYRLVVEELSHAVGPGKTYQLDLDLNPGFLLAIKNENDPRHTFAVPQGNGGFALPVVCTRLGYDGPVHLTLSNPPQGIRLLTPTIPDKATEAVLLLAVDPHLQPGEFRTLGIMASSPDHRFTAPLNSLDAVRSTMPQFATAPHWLDGRIFVAVTDAVDPFMNIESAVSEVAMATMEGQVSFDLKLVRTNPEFKTPVFLAIENLPGYLQHTVKQENDVLTVTIQGPKQGTLPAAQHLLRVQVLGQFQGRGAVVPVDVRLKIE